MLSNWPVVADVNPNARVVNDRWYLDVDGHPIIVGEVENVGDVALKDVEVVLLIRSKFLDETSEKTWTIQIWSPEVLEPGFKAPFREWVLVFGDFLGYEVKGVTFTIGESKPLRLQVLTMETYEDGAGCLHITGEIKNDGERDIWGFTAVGIFYDQDGRVVAVTKPNYISSEVRSGGTGRYDVAMEPTDVNQKPLIDHYALVVDSYYYNMIPEFPHTITALLMAVGATLLTLRRKTKPIEA
jgi:hypothetical protein